MDGDENTKHRQNIVPKKKNAPKKFFMCSSGPVEGWEGSLKGQFQNLVVLGQDF